jgi:hypothetical protein
MLRMDNLDSAIASASKSRSHLVFLSSCPPAGSSGHKQININSVLSEQLISIPRSERAKYVERMVGDLINNESSDTVLLHGLEMLFDRSLAIDPLRLLSACSKHKILLVHWPGDILSTGLSYAIPSHPEYRNYRASDLSDVILLESDVQTY